MMPKKPEDRSMIQPLHGWFMSHNIPELFTVVSESRMFNIGSVETVINSVAIMEMLNIEQLDISCILWYQICILDSARGTKTLKDYTIVEHVNKAVTWFKKTKTDISRLCPMTWNLPKNIWKDKNRFFGEELDERVKTWMRTFGDKVKLFSSQQLVFLYKLL
ncbi:unnamed protein product [Lactuca virosa]|uniref:Uncharacterized protein n=1 Tax=Lactuca virosa TaxID=75947 RepID=A0AAU9NGK4_9ASTR|nr:unnamed protein product [Lactuca virosa]